MQSVDVFYFNRFTEHRSGSSFFCLGSLYMTIAGRSRNDEYSLEHRFSTLGLTRLCQPAQRQVGCHD